MKYLIGVNQPQALALGIKNINMAHIFDLLMSASTWSEPIAVDKEVYYWVARQKICSSLPLLNLKEDTVYRHLKALAKLGLIDYIKQGKKDLIKITKKGKEYLLKESENTMSEINPNYYVGNKSEKNSEINPTYTTININSTNKKTKAKKGESLEETNRTKDTELRREIQEIKLSALKSSVVVDFTLSVSNVDKATSYDIAYREYLKYFKNSEKSLKEEYLAYQESRAGERYVAPLHTWLCDYGFNSSKKATNSFNGIKNKQFEEEEF